MCSLVFVSRFVPSPIRATRYGPPKGLLWGLARSVKGDDPNH
jgi:hypothetical protein